MVAASLEPYLIARLRNSAQEILTATTASTTSIRSMSHAEERSFSDEVIGLLSFTGTESGTFFLRTSRELADKMAAQMLMMEPSELTSFGETADALGEIINMVAGNFKNAWVADGNEMELSIPHVVQSGNMHINIASMTGMCLGVRADIEGMHVDIDMHFQA